MSKFLPALREMLSPAPTNGATPALPPKRVPVEVTIDVTVSFTTKPLHWRDGPVIWTMGVDRDRAEVLAAALRASPRIVDVTVT